MKILTAQQLKELDAFSIERQNISSADLMQRAASKCFNWINKNLGLNHSFSIVCGPGNNGGDGLVIAQLLSENNCDVECILLNFTDKNSPDYELNLTKLQKTECKIRSIQSENELESIKFNGKIVVDAIFGFGLSRPAEGLAAAIIKHINSCKTKKVIAIDLPSGLYCDQLNAKEDQIIQADFTLTFHVPKLSFFFPEGGNSVGKVIVLDIRLDKSFASKLESNYSYITPSKVGGFLKKRKTFSHKGTYGHTNIIAGSRGKMGAAVLASKAASFSGVGLVTSTIPSVGLNVMQMTVPVAMCDDNYGTDCLEGKIEINDKHTYGIGPGIGKSSETVEFLKHFLKEVIQPIVIDADALNCISENREMLYDIPENSILTPHIKEFGRLAGVTENSLERLNKLVEFCIEHKVYVVLKDARTIICSPQGKCSFSLNGTPGMATGGSGDVLTGILAGLLAQGFSLDETTQLGVVLHGLAGEFSAEKYSEYGMNAESILEEIGEGFKMLLKI
jgi:NAD(P)H-hydrate epimerase